MLCLSSARAIRWRRSRGFTLIEVLIVLAVIGLLSAVAIPSYSEYARRSQRIEAQTALNEAAQFMQRFYAVNDRYDRQRDGTQVELPPTLQRVPAAGAKRYDIVVAEVSPTGFTLEARPTGGMEKDRCGVLVLNGLGQRNVRNAKSGVADCWR
jgi:type IV pilus assembly protein PilE